ncbi:pyridoxal 5'-phosphate synthase [uncultured Friedmanniella sp.]|uniref:pyridoxine/pyridoxamine 5'-phosphate oxidase n=1 Tax=uncultured Friedmanniella sp. TaxID=335381 RepID=UPI0035CA3331
MTATLGEPVEGPHAWARSWLPADDDPVRPLMTLATLGLDGWPAARTVLLSSVSDVGLRFHTDARSAKVAELAADPRVSLVIAFPERAQQLVVQGDAVPESAAESLAAFGRRSAYLRQLAWVNDPEHARLPPADRQRAWATAVAQTPDGPLEPPTSWRGYEVVPHRYVFWEGGPDAASRRTEYVRADGGWSVDHLPG